MIQAPSSTSVKRQPKVKGVPVKHVFLTKHVTIAANHVITKVTHVISDIHVFQASFLFEDGPTLRLTSVLLFGDVRNSMQQLGTKLDYNVNLHFQVHGCVKHQVHHVFMIYQ